LSPTIAIRLPYEAHAMMKGYAMTARQSARAIQIASFKQPA